jgi:hypothetical protein
MRRVVGKSRAALHLKNAFTGETKASVKLVAVAKVDVDGIVDARELVESRFVEERRLKLRQLRVTELRLWAALFLQRQLLQLVRFVQ